MSASHAREAEAERTHRLSALGNNIKVAHEGTKPHLGPLATGCHICSQGEWSCLFINGKCNCRCFYCPTVQDEISVPTTNRIPFAKARDYADYIRHFDFKGVSISGGEPLLTFDSTLRYIETVRRRQGDALHIWLYTNGTLLTAEHLIRLESAGLNEIRFDISAADYDLKKVEMAVGRIPCVTVEIPIIPEDRPRVAELLSAMHDIGVSHLNLHQLRLTPYNSSRLKIRPYTFLHGEKVTVLESELTALALMQTAVAQNIGLPINYCSFVYKHHYQRAANRRRSARFILKGPESITDSGYIRALALTGPAERIGRQAEDLSRHNADPQLWSISAQKDRLCFHERLWPLIDFEGCELMVSYSEALLRPLISYQRAFKEIRINTGRTLYVEKQPLSINRRLNDAQKSALANLVIGPAPSEPGRKEQELGEIIEYELIRPGLQEYF
ncbi:MAG: radical SAM protein [Desulfobacterales bacterium]|uniref:Radical SAM protein n=1 Tax=Candidatus Desulfatibia profunda TaxID=2841695 RepID=A0A8J6NPG1_9BACT|nr:radical SAM protein [Candidatus Desulfatibia profunda]MBL7180978.1 radical SAM protein [Desulfobacterales bacterium]